MSYSYILWEAWYHYTGSVI